MSYATEQTAAEASRNRQAADSDPEVGGVAVERLQSIVTRYERLDEEVAALRGDQKDLLQEAASAGFDKKVLRQLIAIRKRDPADVQEAEALLDLYRKAIGC